MVEKDFCNLYVIVEIWFHVQVMAILWRFGTSHCNLCHCHGPPLQPSRIIIVNSHIYVWTLSMCGIREKLKSSKNISWFQFYFCDFQHSLEISSEVDQLNLNRPTTGHNFE